LPRMAAAATLFRRWMGTAVDFGWLIVRLNTLEASQLGCYRR
jgi:hypothetical protein